MARNLHSMFIKSCLIGLSLVTLSNCMPTDEFNPWTPTGDSPPAQSSVTVPDPAAPSTAPSETQPLHALKAPSDGSSKVALLLPLSGRGADKGQAMLNAAQLAMFDLQAGNLFELLPIDTNGGASAAIKKAVDSGAGLVLGPLFSDDAKAIAPVAVQYGIPVVSFSTDTSAATGTTFLMGFMPQTQIEHILDYSAARGMRRIALIAPRDTYGDTAATAFVSYMQRHGLTNGGIVRYAAGAKPSSDDLLSIAQTSKPVLGQMGIDAVLIAAPAAEAAAASEMLTNAHGMPPNLVKRLGTGLWDTSETSKLSALQGAWYAASSPRLRAPFEQRYKATYGTTPPRLASLAYDGAALAVVLAKSGHGYSRAALSNPNGFFGIDGVFRFGSNGIAERGLAILEVRQDGAAVIQDAAPNFKQTR